MNISSADVGSDTSTEVEVREYAAHIEIRMVTPRHDIRPVRVWVDGQEVHR